MVTNSLFVYQFRSRRFLFFLSACLMLLATGRMAAQQPVFKNFSVKEGLPSSEVYSVMQDSKGYLWFTTDAGVSRYDGYSFRNYSTRDGLADNTVFSSCEDRKGRIWFRTLSGRLFYFQNDTIQGIGANESILPKTHSSIMSSLYLDARDTIWCGNAIGKGMYRIAPPYRKQDFVFIRQPGVAYIYQPDSAGFVYGSLENDVDNVTSHGQHPVQVKKTSRMGPVVFDSTQYTGFPNWRILKTRNQSFIILNGNLLHRFGTADDEHSENLSLVSVYEDKTGNIWVGMKNGGVALLKNGKLKDSERIGFLKGLTVSGITEDTEGGFWFTTLENGVFYMPSRNFLYFDKTNGLTANKVFALFPRDDSHILAAVEGGAVFDISGDSVKQLLPAHQPGLTNIYTFYQGEGSNEIIAGAGVSYRFIPQQGFVPRFIRKENEPCAFKCFTRDRQEQIWAGNYLFLNKLDAENTSVIESYVCKSRISAICCDAADRIWLGCVNGLWWFKDGKFSYCGDQDPIFKNRIDDIRLGADSTWWFATKGAGVIVKRGNRICVLDDRKGLSSNICKHIFLDNDGTAWISTNNGICRVQMNSWDHFSVEVYSSEDGLPSNEINQVTGSGNRIWAATNAGIVTFEKNTAFANQTPPPVYISMLEINSKNTLVRDSFHLRYFENYLKINFVGLSYKRSSKLRYLYKLSGLDTSWTSTANTSLQYTTLPPGAYTFEVYAVNNDGVKSLHPARFYFTISKPFWKEWWFILLVSLILILVVGSLVTIRIRRLNQRVLEKSEVSRKLAETRLIALRAQMNPHFIFNSINSIQLFILKNDTDAAHKHLTRFSKLIRKVLENSKNEYISIAEEIQTLELYIELERLRFSSKFIFEIRVSDEIQAESVLISPLLIQPYVENAIWHGLMHLKDREGVLKIRIGKKGEMLQCIIEDNGIGRKHSLQYKKKTEHKSMAMSLNKERVEIISKLHHQVMSLTITDKTDALGLPSGTQVEILFPFIQTMQDDAERNPS